MCLGERLGLYRALKGAGPEGDTPADLAASLGLQQRYVTEWCRQQASAKIICTDEVAERFWLSPAQQDVLVNELGADASPFFFIGALSALPTFAQIAAPGGPLEEVFKKGGGIKYDAYGPDVTCGVCRELAVWVRHNLVDCLKQIPGLGERLEAGCKVADVGCGCGEALMAVAAAFPQCQCFGYDISQIALSAARKEAERRGLTNVQFLDPGLEEEKLSEEPTYQLIITHDAVHDMARPSAVMPHCRKALLDDGCWVIGDMSALESHGANVHGHPLAPLLYGFSCHICLPSGMSAPGAEGLGTLGISESKMKAMLKGAGFGSAEVLDWESPLNRFYIARPYAAHVAAAPET
eukprot:scaffold7.g3698.t1